MTETMPTGTPPAEGTAVPSPFARTIAMFTSPARAWAGLESHAQWWFPFVLVLVFNAAWGFLLYPRAILPMVIESMERQVADGTMPADRLDAAQRFMTSPAGMALALVPQTVVQALMILLTAAVLLFAIGFVLGVKFDYRRSLEVASWGWMLKIPEMLVFGAVAWVKESMLGVHVGFGAVLPEPDTPSRLMTGLGHFLDSLGPLALWPVAVGVIGACALSGAPRRSATWILGVLDVVLSAVWAALSSLNTPAS